jgi:PAS domain S-box-containing protein
LNLIDADLFEMGAPPPDAGLQLADALDCLRVAVTVFDREECLLYANRHFNYLFRSLPPREQLLGRSYEELVRLEIAGGEIAPYDAADPERFVLRRRSQLRAGEYRPLDVNLADGRVVEIKARRTQDSGWIALWTDITAARQAEARLRDAVALSADAFVFFDKNDRVALCNDAYASFFGFARAEEIFGTCFGDLMERARRSTTVRHGLSPEEWVSRRIAAHTAPAGAMTIELNDGTAFLVRDRATSEGGRVVVFTDVTDRRRAEAALAEQARALAETRSEAERQASYLADLTRRFDEAEASANSAKTTLLRNMSHELKTPLNAIIGFSDLMLSLDGQLSAAQVSEYSMLIRDGGRNLLRLINQILDLTKLSAGHYDFHRSRFDTRGILSALVGDFAAKAETGGVSLESDAPDGELRVDADENAVATMLGQLVENALFHAPQGGWVRLSACRDGAQIRLTVADNGPGVAPQDIARILMPFEQGGRGMADHTSGAGLGLTLVKALAEAQGGSLLIESAPGAGFAATIALPAADSQPMPKI